MASSQVQQLDPALLLRAFQGVSPGEAITTGQEAYNKGSELASVLQQRKMQNLMDAQKVRSEMEKAKTLARLKETFAMTPSAPQTGEAALFKSVPTPKPIQDVSGKQTMQAVSQVVPTAQVPDLTKLDQTGEVSIPEAVTPEQIASQQESAYAAYDPEGYFKGLMDIRKEQTKQQNKERPMSDSEYNLANTAYQNLPGNAGKTLPRDLTLAAADKLIGRQTSSIGINLSKYRSILAEHSLNLREATTFFGGVQKAKNNPIVSKARESINTLRNVLANVGDGSKEGNLVFIQRLGGLVQKLIAQDNGNLAAWEQRQPGSAALWSQMAAKLEEWKTGDLTPENRQMLIDLLRETETNLRLNIAESVDSDVQTLSSVFGKSPEEVRKAIALGEITKETPSANVDLGKFWKPK